MNSKNDHCANRNQGNNAKPNIVDTTAEVDDAKYRQQVNNVIKGYVKDEMIFMNMPIEENYTYYYGR